MGDLAPFPLTPFTPSDPRWEVAQRVAESQYFRKGPKLRAFLLYVCENAILGRSENLTAQLIGTRVFGRSPEFDLSEDNIVRVEARELRKRLEAYFASEGCDEPIVIEIPKGNYAPVFRLRTPATAPEVVEVEAAPIPAEQILVAERKRSWLVPMLAATAFFAIAATVWLATKNGRLRQQLPGPSSANFAFYSDLLGTMGMVPGRETLLVLSNPNALIYYASETIDPAPLPHSYRAPGELKTSLGFLLRPAEVNYPYQFLSLSRDEFTGIGEAVAAFRLAQLTQSLGRQVHLTQTRFLNWDHVAKQDLVLLGGPSSNDWSYQNDSKSSFAFVRDAVEIAKPLPGEQKRYLPEGSLSAGMARIEYGIIKMLTSPYGFKTLLFAGVTSAGTAGVAEFFSTPQKMAAVHKSIRAAAPGKVFPSDWEVLLRIAVRDNLPVAASVVAVRPPPNPSPVPAAH
jgi:hypothetical protein